MADCESSESRTFVYIAWVCDSGHVWHEQVKPDLVLLVGISGHIIQGGDRVLQNNIQMTFQTSYFTSF